MEKADMIIKKLADGFSSLENCSALAVSGSRTSAIHDDASDWDIYIYSSTRIDPAVRKKLLSSLTDDYRICSSFFEEGDDFTAEGICFDLMYRDTGFVHEQIRRVWTDHTPSLGYTTCFLHNLKTSCFLFDKAGLEEEIRTLDGEYPQELSDRIIEYNMKMMYSGEGCWMNQLRSAVMRDDFVSRNHRLAALMASYFDILFAYNKVFHPGEKKLVRYAHLLCPSLPQDFDSDLNAVYSAAYQGDLTGAVERILDHLRAMIRRT